MDIYVYILYISTRDVISKQYNRQTKQVISRDASLSIVTCRETVAIVQKLYNINYRQRSDEVQYILLA